MNKVNKWLIIVVILLLLVDIVQTIRVIDLKKKLNLKEVYPYIGHSPPDIQVKNCEGNSISIKEIEIMENTLLTVLSPGYCPPCINEEAKFLSSVQRNFEDLKIVHIIVYPARPKELRNWIEGNNIKGDIYFDSDNKLRIALRNKGNTPLNILLKGGKIKSIFPSPENDKEINKFIGKIQEYM